MHHVSHFLLLLSSRANYISPSSSAHQWKRHIQNQSTHTVSRSRNTHARERPKQREMHLLRWNGTWISDRYFSFIDEHDSIWLYNCDTLQEEILFNRETIQQENIGHGIVSPSARYVLIPRIKSEVTNHQMLRSKRISDMAFLSLRCADSIRNTNTIYMRNRKRLHPSPCLTDISSLLPLSPIPIPTTIL